MKKVININFQGQVIAIEETAYDLLNQYIESLKSYFSREEDGEEIVNDIECRIAELFGNRLKHGIHCITDEDVESIIENIGKPQDFDTEYDERADVKEEMGASPAASGSEHHANEGSNRNRTLYRNLNDRIIGGVCSGLAHYFRTDPVWLRLLFVMLFGFLFWVYIVLWIVLRPKSLAANMTKRLYRNPSDRYIGGVCGGMAAYFRIDSWIPRLIFLLPLMLNLIGVISFFPLDHFFRDLHFSWNINAGVVIVYIVLWIIIPEARTVKQKLEMMGEDEYIRTIRERVNDNVASSRSRSESDNSTHSDALNRSVGVGGAAAIVPMEEMPPEPPVTRSPLTTTAEPERSGCLNGFVILMKIIFFSLAGLFALTLVGLFSGFLFAGARLIPMKTLFIDPGYESSLLIASLVLILLIPVIAVIVWIVRRVMKARSRPVIGIVATVLWLAGIVVGGILTYHVVNKFSEESSMAKRVPIAPVTADKLYVDMLPYTDDYATFNPRFGINFDTDRLPYTNVNKDSLLFRNINLHIRKSPDSLFHVRSITASCGRDLLTAKSDLEQFSYEILQNDSLLLLPEFFSVPVSQGFRDQSITIEIAVPAGKTIEVSDVLGEYKENEPPKVVRKRIITQTSQFVPVEVRSSEDKVEMTSESL